ncbi:MAG TPA: magnesium transporter, partial [Xanthomonadaceae bacterium]|nr:magnesium transporter [Xanthomonadaceae bacterium]
ARCARGCVIVGYRQRETVMPRTAEHDLRELDSRSVARQLRGGSDAEIASALLQLTPEQAHKVLERFDPARREAIDRADPEHDLLIGYDYAEGTVGRLMESAPAIFPPAMTIAAAIESLREVIKQRMVIYVFVADAQGVLCGVVAFRELMFGARDQSLAEVMVHDPFFLEPTMSLVDAMHEVVTRHYPIYPVCQPDGRLLGLVKGAALFEQQAFAISAQAGAIVGVEKEERLATSWQRSFLYRHPWLLVNLLTVAISASVVSVFQASINRIVVLAIFLPVMSGQCGNLGNQSLAVVLRGVTLGELHQDGVWPMVLKEGWLGVLNGFVSGLLAGAVMFWIATARHEPALSLAGAIVVAMTASCAMAGMAGASIPLVLRRLGADPATAAGIFLSTVTDVLSMGLFLGLATALTD